MDKYILPHFLSRRAFVAAAGVSAASMTSGAEAAQEPTTLPKEKSNFGQCACDDDLRAAWKQFCRELEASGDRVFKRYNPPTPLSRADGFRFLTQNLSQAFVLAYETYDENYPVLYPFTSPYRKLGGDNADQVQHHAWLDGKSVYKVSGNKGTARFFNFAVMAARPEHPPTTGKRTTMWPFGDPAESNMFAHDLETDWEGNFELYIGGPKRGPNWLPSTPNTRRLYTRQVFDAWDEKPARMRIERLGMTTPRPVPTPEDMVKAMRKAERFMFDLLNDYPDRAYEFSASMDPTNFNKFPSAHRNIADTTYNAESDKIRGRSIINMTWKLAPDEALIMEFDEPKSFWALTNYGAFLNSMDFLYRTVSWTPGKVKVDKDGKIRMVLAHEDPGYHNWIDTQRFSDGNITSRVFLSDKFIKYRTRVVKHAKLASALPADSVKVTPAERTQQMLERFHAHQLRHSW